MSVNSRIIPCIWLDDQAEEAGAFYAHAFPGSHVTGRSHYPESGDNPSSKPPGSVLTVEAELAGRPFTLLNGGPMFVPNPSMSFFVHVDEPKEADRLFGILAEGGKALMPLDEYPWSPRYGWIQDRFNVSWQVITGRSPHAGSTIAPCLMFAGPQHGRAEEAMRLYTGIFPGSRIDAAEHYAPGEGPVETVKHGRFVLDGQTFVAMDSHVSHDITFSEALSLQVMCEDQKELDRYWDALGDGGEFGPCGWLKDRFGLSWQVVPASMTEWLLSEDAAARDRAFAALLEMSKLDIATLERAYRG